MSVHKAQTKSNFRKFNFMTISEGISGFHGLPRGRNWLSNALVRKPGEIVGRATFSIFSVFSNTEDLLSSLFPNEHILLSEDRESIAREMSKNAENSAEDRGQKMLGSEIQLAQIYVI